MEQRERLIELLDTNCGFTDEQPAEKLADYLLANGVIVLPCNVGDTVYQLGGDLEIVERIVNRISIEEDGIFLTAENRFFETKMPSDRVFLYREEAEKFASFIKGFLEEERGHYE